MVCDPPRRWRTLAHPEVPDAVGAALASVAAGLPHDSAVLSAERPVPAARLARTNLDQKRVRALGHVLFGDVGRSLEIEGRS